MKKEHNRSEFHGGNKHTSVMRYRYTTARFVYLSPRPVCPNLRRQVVKGPRPVQCLRTGVQETNVLHYHYNPGLSL